MSGKKIIFKLLILCIFILLNNCGNEQKKQNIKDKTELSKKDIKEKERFERQLEDLGIPIIEEAKFRDVKNSVIIQDKCNSIIYSINDTAAAKIKEVRNYYKNVFKEISMNKGWQIVQLPENKMLLQDNKDAVVAFSNEKDTIINEHILELNLFLEK